MVAAIRAKHEIDVVARDELRILLHAEIDVRLIVENLQRETIGLVADADAARLIDAVDRDLIAVAEIAREIGIRAGQLQRGTQRHRFRRIRRDGV